MMKRSNGDSSTETSSNADNNMSKSSKATGPKTAAGKRRVRNNALKHGFFSKQLIVQENEKGEFEALRAKLMSELKPKTTMQMVAFERLLCAIWRVKEASRIEEGALRAHLSYELEQAKRSEDGKNSIEPPRWYTSGRGAMLKAVKMASDLRDQLREDGGEHLEDQKEWIVKTFGDEFYDSLVQWRPENTTAILASEHLAKHAETYKMPLPAPLDSEKLDGGEKIVVDPRAKWDMIVKLLEIKLQDLAEIYRLLGRGTDQSVGEQHRTALDNVVRYITSAVRELERAYDWYLKIQDGS